jgi:hypothetical protein
MPLQALQFGLSKLHVLSLGELVAANSILALNHDVTHRAVVAVLNAGATLIVQPVERDVLCFGF